MHDFRPLLWWTGLPFELVIVFYPRDSKVVNDPNFLWVEDGDALARVNSETIPELPLYEAEEVALLSLVVDRDIFHKVLLSAVFWVIENGQSNVLEVLLVPLDQEFRCSIEDLLSRDYKMRSHG